MEYDGVRLPGVPLANIAGLGFSWPLAEARAGALASALTGVTPSTLDVSLLRRIDTAPDPNAIAASLVQQDCAVHERICARHSISSSLHTLRDRVQDTSGSSSLCSRHCAQRHPWVQHTPS